MGDMADMANDPWVEAWEVSDHASPHFDEALAWEREGESGAYRRRRVDKYAADKCPRCGADLRPLAGKHGPFMGCTRYPDCKGSRCAPIGSGARISEEEA
jgi:ssDNA-binding Zn-finger/Zn-ribbon topoisomerase 1